MRVLGYVGVSTDEQTTKARGSKRHAIITECERRGWHVVEVIEDAGFSAKDPGDRRLSACWSHGTRARSWSRIRCRRIDGTVERDEHPTLLLRSRH